ncbi:MAG TPA: universal stress protein [Chthoniobacteraceae bacterium]|nr:universal stress protein [Chthoniobacteraceae bacterium]
MYRKILVALDATDADRAILEHVSALAKALGSKVSLLHVADGWAARLFGKDAVSPEISKDTAYLESVRARLAAEGLDVEAELSYGEPSDEIIRRVGEGGCDFVALTTHGHKFLTNALLGTTVDKVRRMVNVPVLLIKAQK